MSDLLKVLYEMSTFFYHSALNTWVLLKVFINRIYLIAKYEYGHVLIRGRGDKETGITICCWG